MSSRQPEHNLIRCIKFSLPKTAQELQILLRRCGFSSLNERPIAEVSEDEESKVVGRSPAKKAPEAASKSSRAAGKGKPSEREKSLPPLEVSNAKVLELLQLVEDQQAALKTHKRSFGDVPFATDFGYEALKGALELL